MNGFWSFVLYAIPWWLWGLLGLMVLAAVAFIWKGIGPRNLIMIAIGIGAAVVLGRSRQKGYQDRKSEEEKEHDRIEKEYHEIDNLPRNVDAAYKRLRDD